MMNLDLAPEDILVDILLRLPAKSLGRFVSVSKLWRRIIRGRDFNRSYSSQPPHLLLLAFNNAIKASQQSWFFFSKSTHVSTPLCSFKREPAPPTHLVTLWRARVDRRKGRISRKPKAAAAAPPSHLVTLWRARVDRRKGRISRKPKAAAAPPEPPDFVSTSTVCHFKKRRYIEPCYVRGLISFLYGEEQVICNPSSGKSITLPTVQNSTEMIVRSFLGYDPINAQYKVLCLTNVKRFCDHQVLTLAQEDSSSSSWRMIQCSTPHYPLGRNSVCIDGVLYYTASPSHNMKEPVLVGFDLSSENLGIVSLFPEGIGSSSKLHEVTLIDYHGKVALVTRYSQTTFTMWVLDDVHKQEWSKECIDFSLAGTRDSHGSLNMLGASDMGEFIFATTRFQELVVYFVDHKRNKIRRVELQGTTKYKFRDFSTVFIFLNHVESVMFI